MRRIAAQIEGLAAMPFVLFVGLGGGALQSVPRFFVSGTDGPRPQLAQLLAISVTAVLWCAAAAFLWWIAVRRRQWSLWATATHVTLGLLVADLLSSGLAMVAASIDTNGAFAEALVREPLTVASSNLVLALIRSPFWFVGSAIAIALGRYLSRPPQTIAPPQSPPTSPHAVT